jgi:four helix bundle protein
MIRDFTDLRVWQGSKELAVFIYLITSKYPKVEIFGLTKQIRRASVSVGSNIAEGFGRYSKKDQAHFYSIASGSLYELKSQMILSRELKYVNQEDYSKFLILADNTHRQLNSLIKVHKSNISSQSSNV